MIVKMENKLLEFDEDESKIIKFFLENSFKTLSELINDPMISPDFVFPGIFDLDKAAMLKFFHKVEDLGVNVYQIDPQKIKPEEEFSFDKYMK